MSVPAKQDDLPLQPSSVDEARKPLAILFAAYPEPWTNREASHAKELIDAKVNAYLLALEGIPAWAVERAVKDFLQGRIERKKRGVLPTAEEIASESHKRVEAEGARQRKQRELQKQKDESEEERKHHEWLKTPEGRAHKEKQAKRMVEIMERYGLRSMSGE